MRNSKRSTPATTQPDSGLQELLSWIAESHFPWVIKTAQEHPLGPKSRFWVACAHDRLRHPLPAVELLTQARLEGYETATAMLGLIYHAHQETASAQTTLEAIDESKLDSTGQLLKAQLQAALAHQNGDHERASQAILQAQPHALEPQHRIFRPRLAKLALLIAANSPGPDQHWMLEHLGHLDPIDPQITSTTPEQHDQLAAIFEAKLEPFNYMLQAHIHLIRAHYHHTQGHTDQGFRDLERILALIIGRQQTELQLHAQLGFAHLSMSEAKTIQVQEHLERAKSLAANNVGLQTHLKLALARWHTKDRHDDVLQTLRSTQTNVLALQRTHDNAINYLHMCELMLQHDQAENAQRALEAGRRILGRMDQANTVLELEHLPLTRAKLLSTHLREINPNETGEVLLKTLGTAQIQHNTRHVKLNIGLSRTLAILTYLLEHPNADLNEIQYAVFDGQNTQFRSYLHQSRYELQRKIPGLNLSYDRGSRTYNVETNLRLRWDAQELLDSLRELNHSELLNQLEAYKGPFLNALDTPWTEEMRNEIEAQLTQQGTKVLEQLYAQNHHELCLQLATRLLKINPFIPEVIAIQIQATVQLHGEIAGKQLQTEIARSLKAQFSGIPKDFSFIQHIEP